MQNIQLEYTFYDTYTSLNNLLGTSYNYYPTHLSSLVCETEFRNARFVKEILIPDIKEIGQIKEDCSFTVFLKDGKSIDIKGSGATELIEKFLKERFPDHRERKGIAKNVILVGDAVTDSGTGSFELDFLKLKEDKVKSIKFGVSDSEKWTKVSKFSLLLSQALQSFIKGDVAVAKSKLNEAIIMCQ